MESVIIDEQIVDLNKVFQFKLYVRNGRCVVFILGIMRDG